MKSLRVSILSAFAFVLLSASLVCADAIQPIAGAPVQTKVLASGITTNTTTSLIQNIPNGAKTFFGEVVCSSGTCTQTQAIFGTLYSTAINGVLLCTITLSAGTKSALLDAVTISSRDNGRDRGAPVFCDESGDLSQCALV